jgi:hypothetical protein
MIVTNKFILENCTKSGGYTKRQASILGLSWPLARGWKKRIQGHELTDKEAADFIQAANIKVKSNLMSVQRQVKELSTDELGVLIRWLANYQ